MYEQVQTYKFLLKIFDRVLNTKQSNVCFDAEPMAFYLFVYNYKEHLDWFWWNLAFILQKTKNLKVLSIPGSVSRWHRLLAQINWLPTNFLFDLNYKQ